MGGIADYSGALVLQWPIREATRAALLPWPERRSRSHPVGRRWRRAHCDVPAGPGRRCTSVRYDDVRAWFARDPARHWAAYVAGVFLVLSREHGVALRRRVPAILIESDVPEGKGVSSSAAIEAADDARARWSSNSTCRRGLALLCQQVENLIVGAPCGVMDQMAPIRGEAGQPHGAAVPARGVRGRRCRLPRGSRSGASIPASAMR